MISIEKIQLEFGTEIALVLLCCRVHFNTETRPALQNFINKHPINWARVQSLSGYHRIDPMIFGILGNATLPNEVAEQIKQKRLYLIQKNFKQALETERLIELLSKNNIDCRPYKGPTFSKQFYGDIVSRESSDIDLVISPRGFGTIISLMRKEGYSFENQLEYDYFGESIYEREKGLEFNKYKDGHRNFHVEFHWRISPNNVSVKKEAHSLLFQRGEEIVLTKTPLKALNRNAHFVAMFIHHSCNDAFCVLRNIIDIGQIRKCNTFTNEDKIYISNTLKNLSLWRAASVCTFLCGELLGVSLFLSPKKESTIRPPIKRFFTERLLHQKMLGKHAEVTPFKKSNYYLKETNYEKIKYIFTCVKYRFIPSSKDIRMYRLPKKLYFLYMLLKPFRSLFFRISNEEKKRVAQQQK